MNRECVDVDMFAMPPHFSLHTRVSTHTNGDGKSAVLSNDEAKHAQSDVFSSTCIPPASSDDFWFI